jgi:hypothetical protein
MRVFRLNLVLACIYLLSSSVRVFAGAVSPCEFPHIFKDVDVNIVVLPFTTTTIDQDARYKDLGGQLALLMKLETLYEVSHYQSVGVTLLSGNEFECDPARVANKIAVTDRRPGSAVILLWGRLFEQSGQIYVQSRLSFIRAKLPEIWKAEIKGHIFEGTLSSQTFSLASQHLLAGDLMEIAQNYLVSSTLYDSPDLNSPSTSFSVADFWKCVGCGHDELAYHILGRSGPWLEVVTIQGQHGYFKADIHLGNWRLDKKLPELSFIEALVAYFSTVVQHSGDTTAAINKLHDYALAKTYIDDESRSVALQLAGIIEANNGRTVEAKNDFGVALSYFNTNADARNLAAMAKFQDGTREELGFESDLLDAAVLDPKNPFLLMNLESLYELMGSGFAAMVVPTYGSRYSPDDIKTRLALVQKIRAASSK